MQIKKKHTKIIWLIVAMVLLVVSALSWIVISNLTRVDSPIATTTPAPTPVTPVSLNSKIMFVGDVFWGRRMNNWAQASELKEAYPFSGLSGFDRESYNAWVGDMECPSDPNVQATTYEEEELLKFNCPSSYLPELAKWFDIMSLANNHTDNQGVEGFAATQQQLDKNGIQYFGHYDPYLQDQACEVVSMPVSVARTNGSTTDNLLPFALCAYHGVFKIPPDESLAMIQEYSKYMPVIAYPHMGAEYQTKADQLRTDLYRQMIDYGADAVLGDHPHWVQNSEAYKGKLIVYSMGNFMFDQQDSNEVTRSAVITLDLSTDQSVNTEQLASWIKLGEKCKNFADDCLTIAKDQNLSKLPLVFKFSMSASDDGGKLTKPANAATAQAVANRLGWNETAKQLVPVGETYVAQ